MDRWHAGIPSVRRRLRLWVENQGAEGSRHVAVRLRGVSLDPGDPQEQFHGISTVWSRFQPEKRETSSQYSRKMPGAGRTCFGGSRVLA